MSLRRIVPALVAAASLAPSAHAGVVLMPGTTYSRQVQLTVHGPVVMHVLTAPKPTGLYALRTLLSNGLVTGRETVSSMERSVSRTATVAGVNGDFFHWQLGYPSGMLLQSGVLHRPPLARRSSIGVDANGVLQVGRVAFFGTWKGTGPSHPFQTLNRPARRNEAVLFTPAWGSATPPAKGTVEVMLEPFPKTVPNTDLNAAVVAIRTGGGTPIPADGAVFVARDAQAAALAAEAPIGSQLTLRLILRPTWTGIVDALGGGPVLVREGAPVFQALEDFTPSQVVGRDPRTAVGQRADGSLVFIVVDGRQPGYSVGITNFDLAQALVRLHCVTGSALDSGGSSTMAFDGRVLNRPSDRTGERPVAEALVIAYTGVYVPPLRYGVVSPNGDGVAESQALRYKLVRPASVEARLVGPDAAVRAVDVQPRQPGTYSLPWNGQTPEGTYEPEGRWRWIVTTVDDQGRRSSMERVFSLNTTLGFLALRSRMVVPHKRARPIASFMLARSAVVSTAVLGANGGLIRAFGARRLEPGQSLLRWNGRLRNGRRVRPGGYRLRVVAWNEVGRSELSTTFVVRSG